MPKSSPVYEYNMRFDGMIFYFAWCSEDTILGLWKCTTLEGLKERIPEGWTLVRKLVPEIEEV